MFSRPTLYNDENRRKNAVKTRATATIVLVSFYVYDVKQET